MHGAYHTDKLYNRKPAPPDERRCRICKCKIEGWSQLCDACRPVSKKRRQAYFKAYHEERKHDKAYKEKRRARAYKWYLQHREAVKIQAKAL